MRTILVGLISLAATTLSFGQGAVNFQNSTTAADPLKLSSPPDRLVRWGASAHFLNAAFTNTGGVYSNSVPGLVAQLYQGNSLAVEGTLTAVATAPLTFRPSTSAQVGVWRGITGVPLPDIAPTNSGKLQVRVFDSTYAPTYEAAVALGNAYPGLLGKSALFNYTPPDTNGTALPPDFNMTNFLGFSITAPNQEGAARFATNIFPASRTNVVGTTATFTIAAAGEPTISYQWYKSPATVAVGQTSPTLTLNYVQLAEAGGYYCIISNAFGMATSSVGTLTVTGTEGLLGLTLLNPKTKTDHTSATITVDGKITAQSPGIANILVNAGQGWTAATISSNTATKIFWTNSSVTLRTGTNSVFAEAIDNNAVVGYSKTNLVFLRVPSTLTLLFDSSRGTVVGNLLKTPSTPAGQTPANAASLDVERSYTLNITPGAGFLFSNVLQVINGSTSVLYSANPAKQAQKGDKKVGFTMKTNLTLIVNFITNRFVSSAGIYYGLYMEGTTAHESSGWFTVKTDSKLKFTGKLLQEGTTVPFGGTFDLAGVGTPKPGKNIARKLYPSDILTLGLQLDLGTGVNLSGTVQSTNWGGAAAMDADKSFDGAKVPLTLPSSVTKAFAMVMAGSATPSTLPGGDGYALNSTGIDPAKSTLKVKGYTGEGPGVKLQSVQTGVFTNGSWPFYAQLYKDTGDPTHYHGAMIGWLTINDGDISGDVVWTKKSTATTLPYSGGFTTMFSSGGGTLLSSAVTNGTTGANLPGLASALTLTIQDGGYVPSPFVTNVTYALGKISPKMASGIKVIIKTKAEANGQVDLVPNKWVGVALQNAGTVRGAFTTGGATSGSVRLTP